MDLTLKLKRGACDDNRVVQEVGYDLGKDCQIRLIKDTDNWLSDEETPIHMLWIEYGKDKEHAIMFDAELDNLELFASSILKSIDMLRRDYSDVIKQKITNNDKI